ncbi:MAG: shikimate kinase [Thermoguttaceae bacterium]
MLLALIGYRATGKTTLAKLLAERLGWAWIDADPEIERVAGQSIERIFAERGEPAFRDLESQVIADLCRRDRLVLATGGGAPLRPENRHALRTAGKIVWLRARPETILARMTADPITPARRPNLTDKSPLAEIVQLLEVRTPLYEELADLAVDTEGKSPDELAAEILTWLQSLEAN